MALTVSEAGEEGVTVPLAGGMVSQEPPEEVVALAVKVREPPPVLETCSSKVKPRLPWVAVKLIFCVSTPSAAGVPGSTVSVTATVVVAGAALGAVIVIVPWYVPIVRSVGSRSEEHTSELQSLRHLACRLL